MKNLEDEVYFFFKSTAEFKEILGFFSAANAQAQISEGKDKDAYLSKAAMIRKKLIKYLSENKNTCFDIQYKGQKRQMIEVLRGRYNRVWTLRTPLIWRLPCVWMNISAANIRIVL